MSWVLVRYVLTAALRDKVIWGIGAAFALVVCLSFFSASTAIMEQQQFVLAYMAGGLRIIALLGLSLFIIFFTRRSFDSRDVEFLLTRPLSRHQFVLSHIVACIILATVAGGLIALLVGTVATLSDNNVAFLLWAFGIGFELLSVMVVAFFFAMVLSSPVSAGLACFGFYILARLMGQLMGIFNHAPDPVSMADYALYGGGLIINAIAMVIPRFDLMAQTSWLIYGGGVWQDWVLILAQGIVFLCLVTLATIVDLKRRQF